MQTINDVPILLRREIEALMVAPFLEAFAEELGWEKTLEISRGVIGELANKAGKGMAAAFGANDLEALCRMVPAFSNGGALKVNVVESTEECLRMDVVDCKYAEMYDRLGIKHLGPTLSCQRDTCLFAGFNPDIEFIRTKTIMNGDDRCDFCLKLEKKEK